MNRRPAFACLALGAAALAGCGSDRASRGEGTLDVVATVAPLADIAHNVGGDRVQVTTLVPRTADPHGWRPGPAAMVALGAADVVVWTGGPLDRWAAGIGAGRELALLPDVEPLGADPHWWQDPVRVERAAKEIRNELARADVDGAGYYEAATADFLERLRRLHSDTRSHISTTGTGLLSASPAGAARRWGEGSGRTRSRRPAPRPARTSAPWPRTRASWSTP
jgi:ABC-type Zn uptake system ZnuABC Zn-binding protein ZnuA